MKTFILLALVTNLFASEGKVRNGGDISTRNILFAANNLSQYIDICLSTKSCVEEDKKDNLRQIKEVIIPSNIIFVEKPANLDFFVIDGLEKVAITSNTPGSKIYINLKRIKSMSIADATSLLIHEFGHHLGIKDHNSLDQLGVKVALNAVKSYSIYNLLGTKRFTPQLYYSKNLNPSLYILNNDNYLNISNKIEKLNLCPQNTVLNTYAIVNIFQSTLGSHDGIHLTLPIGIWLRINCVNRNGEILRHFLQDNIDLIFNMDTEIPVYID
ncbi:hypothetical protein [Bacteriovorax sp. Seq25_V]|uniref:hypothetical protein n=1 Tax=Bacteriovorax sp. Seq25_V TaxID=1201288 RepID=UPI000389DE0F|nr:hypothetical protein [Bacteriovorax sp. Seq25_V]EQC44712.1 hypothetical protein M900_0475 [Bacteriovorax sp. Seq25_V]